MADFNFMSAPAEADYDIFIVYLLQPYFRKTFVICTEVCCELKTSEVVSGQMYIK